MVPSPGDVAAHGGGGGAPGAASPCAQSLASVVQDLSLARDLPAIMAIVRTAARELAAADGATFVLRDGDQCFYADEDAIAPLWKGSRFPMSACVSGWVMTHREAVSIPDVGADARVPADVYRPTFVRSMAMVPIRTKAPLGAIGVYWASEHAAGAVETALLQALADSTSVAMENVALSERQARQERLSSLVVHDLKCPASSIALSASLRLQTEGLPPDERQRWIRVLRSADHIHRTALDLLDIACSRDKRLEPRPAPIDLGALFAEVRELLQPVADVRGQVIVPPSSAPPGGLHADPGLLRRVLVNLVDNALRHGPGKGAVRLGARAVPGGIEIDVTDDGPGIPAESRAHVFDRYERPGDPGTRGHGLGLTFCRLAVEAHGGAIRVEDAEPRGCRFRLRIPIPLPR